MKYFLLFFLAIAVVVNVAKSEVICRYVCEKNVCKKVCYGKNDLEEDEEIDNFHPPHRHPYRPPKIPRVNDVEEENKFKIKKIIKGIKKVVHVVDKVTKVACKLPIPSLAVQKACAIRQAIRNDVNEINDLEEDLDMMDDNEENRLKIGKKIKGIIKKGIKIVNKVLHPACKVPLHPTLTKICAMRDAVKNDEEDVDDSNADDDDNDIENKLKFVEKLKELAKKTKKTVDKKIRGICKPPVSIFFKPFCKKIKQKEEMKKEQETTANDENENINTVFGSQKCLRYRVEILRKKCFKKQQKQLSSPLEVPKFDG